MWALLASVMMERMHNNVEQAVSEAYEKIATEGWRGNSLKHQQIAAIRAPQGGAVDAPDGRKFTIAPSETVADGTENGANGAVFTVLSAV